MGPLAFLRRETRCRVDANRMKTIRKGAIVTTTLGARIRSARQSLGLSQRTLAGQAGISQPALANLERDRRHPSFALACRLADALGVSLDRLAGREN